MSLQFAIPFDAATGLDLDALVRELEQVESTLCTAPLRVSVSLRNNRSTMASLRRKRGDQPCWQLTLARKLLHHPPHLVRDLALSLLLRAHRRSVPAECRHNVARLRELWHDAAPEPAAPSAPVEFTLARMLGELMLDLLPEAPAGGPPAIGWGTWNGARTLARYDRSRHRIELHRALAHGRVPEVVLVHLVQHELLHALLGPVRQGSRLVHHHGEFRRRERGHHSYQPAQLWIQKSWRRHLRRHSNKP